MNLEREEAEGLSARFELVDERRVEGKVGETNRLFHAVLLDRVTDIGVVLLSDVLCERWKQRGQRRNEDDASFCLSFPLRPVPSNRDSSELNYR